MKANEAMAKVVEGLLRDRSRPLEALAQKLEFMYPNVRHEAKSAVGHGIEKLIRVSADRVIEDPLNYIFACAANYLKDELTRQKRVESLDALMDDDDDREYDVEKRRQPLQLVDPSFTPEEQVISEAVYRELLSMVAKWETANVRETTRLFLEAAYLAEPLFHGEAAELLTDILSEEEVDEAFVRQWKSRGFKRLKRQIKTMEATEDVVNA